MLKLSRPRSVLGGVSVAAICLFGLVFSVGAASARKAFRIERFSLQTTAPRQEMIGNNGYFNVVNEPYAFTQAGGHPDALTFDIEFASEQARNSGNVIESIVTQDPKDIVTVLPPGLLGNPTAVPRCSLTVLTGENAACSPSTQIGLIRLKFGGGENLSPIYNMVPEAGQSAEFALNVSGSDFFLTAHLVHTAQGYGFTVADNGIPPINIREAELTFWGVPAEARYDWMRGLHCSDTEASTGEPLCGHFGGGGGKSAGVEPVPFLTMGTDCSAGPQVAEVRTDSWETPGSVGVDGAYSAGYKTASWVMPRLTGCNLLAFDPGVEVSPESQVADEPVGLGVNIKMPQPEAPASNGAPHLRNAVVTLPEGMSISPGIVDGIQACEESGPEGINFTGPESEEVAADGEWQLAAGHCPAASTVGTTEAITPDLNEPVHGHVYLARPACGGAGQEPCTEQDALDGRLYQLYLEFGGEGVLGNTGIHVKAHGYVEANPATGQLTTVVDENPQVPLNEVKIHLNGGPRAPLDNPTVCGPATTSTDLTPWSEPGVTPLPEALSVSGTPDATPSSFFKVTGCPAGGPPFAPGLLAGTVSPQAGQYSSFTLNLTRQDREQFVKGIQIHTPPGLLGMLSSVQLCGEPQANDGTCPESSKIGTTRVASGAGSHPFEIEGTVYLTGPHGGAPFGLSVVTPAVAGPFNLGLVVVRASIAVNPVDSTLTVTTDETGPYALPQILDGVPLRLKRITVDIDRPGFMFNPTNCAAQQITAVLSGSGNAKATVSTPFAAAGCASLAFKPQFAVSTSGKTSKAAGASLDAKLSYPAGSVGSEANIAWVKVDLPKQLPSRLTTLQKACTAAQFEANPAGCPTASIVGTVRASTPLLPVGLTGPVYFVSHGGEAFPSLIVVLQGDGVRVDLTGSTFISHAGITSSTFKTVPDVPVSTFEIYLPEGRYSALAANGNLCAPTRTVTVKHTTTRNIKGHKVRRTVKTRTVRPASLIMPTEMVAQNGAVFKQDTKIAVTGCTTAKKTKRKHPRKAKKASADRRSRS
ncbi:MAG TPA: hypothetical protein VIJ66_12125 [Solirubrobacteraceae bacterium]